MSLVPACCFSFISPTLSFPTFLSSATIPTASLLESFPAFSGMNTSSSNLSSSFDSIFFLISNPSPPCRPTILTCLRDAHLFQDLSVTSLGGPVHSDEDHSHERLPVVNIRADGCRGYCRDHEEVLLTLD